MGRSAGSTGRSYHLPSGVRNPRRRPFRSGVIHPPLPVGIPPITEKLEREIVTAILTDLCNSYGVKVNMTPNLECGMATPARDDVDGRIVVIGASHLYRTVEYLLPTTVSVATPGFRPSKEKISELEKQIDRLELNETDTVVLDLLSNTAYMGTDEEGLPLPSYREGDGGYHIAGTLTTAPPTTLRKTLDNCAELGKKLLNSRVILVCPTPRYVVGKCCDDPSHIENFGSNDYADDLTEFQDQHRRLLGGWGVATGLNFEILDLTAVVGPIEPILGKRTTSGGASIWAEGDHVHLSREAYKDTANAIVEMAAGCGNTATGDSASSSDTSGSHKRKQPDSVVTFPAQPAKRKGASVPHGAGWMRGEADRERAYNAPSWKPRGRGWPRSEYGLRHGWAGRSHRGRQRRPW